MKTQFLCILLLWFMLSLKSFGQCSGPLGFEIHTLHHPSTQVSTDGSFEFNYYAQCGLAGSFRILLKRRVNFFDIGVTVYDQSWPWPAEAEPLGGGCISSFFSYETISNLQAGYYDIQFITDVPSQYCDTTYFYNVFQLIPNTLLWYLNADGDNYYTGNPVTQANSPGTGWTSELPPGGSGDCADDPTANPNAINIHPGATEVCGNGIDENCNGAADDVCQTWYHDADGDGYYTGNPVIQGASPGTGWVTGLLAANSGDCADDPSVNPNASNIHPGATEVCNGYDDNCDNQMDEGFNVGRASLNNCENKSEKEYNGKEAEKKIEGATFVKERAGSSYPAWVRFNKSQQKSLDSFMPWLKQTTKSSAEVDFKLMNQENDSYGMQHYRYQQTYKGVPIENAIYLVHTKNNNVSSYNGLAVDADINLSPAPALNETTALEAAKKHIGAARYKWEDEYWENTLKENTKNTDATYFPKGELCWYADKISTLGKNSAFRLAYKFDMYAANPDKAQRVYVDANSGAVLKTLPLETNCVPATVNTIFNGTKDIHTTENGILSDNFILKDDCQAAEFHVKNYNASNHIPVPLEIENSTNTWNTEFNELFGATVLWEIEQAYNYFLSKFQRSSYNNNNGNVLALINAEFWDSDNFSFYTDNASMSPVGIMKVGLGNGNTLQNSNATLDIIGHEFTHAVTVATAGLEYQGESGALNESFSDIFGEATENFSTQSNDWLQGAERSDGPVRSLKSPNFRLDPDTYGSQYFWRDPAAPFDDGGVHHNSGVQNYWFYLLSTGTGGSFLQNDNGDFFKLQGIGMAEAEKVAYRNLTVYLTPTSNYADARFGAIQAAIDLSNGNTCSDMVKEVTNAWYAVGVGQPFISVAASSLSNVSCAALCDGMASALPEGGSEPLTYLWNDPAAQITEDASGLCAGYYSVTVTDASGCSASASATVIDAGCGGSLQTWYHDADGDGYFDITRQACCSPGTGWTNIQPVNGGCDCNDNDAANNSLQTYFVDADYDGFGSTVSVTKCASSAPFGYSAVNTDCNDNNGSVHAERTWYLDADEDGFYISSQLSCQSPGYGWNFSGGILGDCDDNNQLIHESISYYLDNDSDGYGGATQELLCASTAPLGYSINSTDCNDADSTIHPNAFEACNNGIDENCDNIDEQCTECYTILATSKAVLNKNTVWRGAVGVNGLGNKAMVQDSTIITAFATMVRADDIVVRGLSEVATQSLFPAAVSLPPFETSNYAGGTDVVVPEGGAITLSGSVYKNITLGNNATVTFSNSTVDVKSITSGFGAKFKFTNCTRLHVRQALTMGRRNFFNADKKEVIVYDGGNVSIGRRTKFSGILYARGDVTLEDGYRDQGTQIDGLIIGSIINSGKYVQWTRTCNIMSCLPPFSLKSGVESNAAVILKAYPNPFTDKLNIEFTLPEDSKATLEIYNMAGQKLSVIFNGNVKANEVNKVEYVPNNAAGNMIIYRLQTEKGIYINKGVMSQ